MAARITRRPELVRCCHASGGTRSGRARCGSPTSASKLPNEVRLRRFRAARYSLSVRGARGISIAPGLRKGRTRIHVLQDAALDVHHEKFTIGRVCHVHRLVIVDDFKSAYASKLIAAGDLQEQGISLHGPPLPHAHKDGKADCAVFHEAHDHRPYRDLPESP
ncbi:MAG: hypothetical protein WAV09_03040 [Minisyncoccia bacterium]